MAWMTAALPYIQAAGAVVAVGSSVGQANAQKKMAEIQAKQLEEQALADQAVSQTEARMERKRAAILSSRVRALSAASGTGTDSPDVINTMADIDEQGAYNALAALYSGTSSARSKNFAAAMSRAKGKNAKTQGYAKATGSLLTSSQSMYERYA